MFIWSNLIIDLHEISKFHINLKSNCSTLILEQYATGASDKDYSNDIQGWTLAKILSNKNIKYKEHNKSYSMYFKRFYMSASVCLETVLSKLLRLLFCYMCYSCVIEKS